MASPTNMDLLNTILESMDTSSLADLLNRITAIRKDRPCTFLEWPPELRNKGEMVPRISRHGRKYRSAGEISHAKKASSSSRRKKGARHLKIHETHTAMQEKQDPPIRTQSLYFRFQKLYIYKRPPTYGVSRGVSTLISQQKDWQPHPQPQLSYPGAQHVKPASPPCP
jgi:hypothetical protein